MIAWDHVVALIRALMDSPAKAVLVGIILGWGLKSLSDYISMRRTESRTFRKATFFIMRAWKALLDYERGIAYFRKFKPDVQEFERDRIALERTFLARVEIEKNTTWAAVDLLASVDPTIAARIDNTLKNMLVSFGGGLHQKLLEADPEAYQQIIYKHDEIVDFTLNDLWTAALKLSSRCGVVDRWRVGRWFKQRVGKGRDEFYQGMDDQAELLNRIRRVQPPAADQQETSRNKRGA